MQFNAQQPFSHARYADAAYRIMLLNQQPVGWIVIARRDEEMLVVDIALLPEQRNAGIGTLLLRDMMAKNSRADGNSIPWPSHSFALFTNL
jgi:GNAT superfamily N-acetyltransferase